MLPHLPVRFGRDRHDTKAFFRPHQCWQKHLTVSSFVRKTRNTAGEESSNREIAVESHENHGKSVNAKLDFIILSKLFFLAAILS